MISIDFRWGPKTTVRHKCSLLVRVGQRYNVALLLDMLQFLAGRRDPSRFEVGSFWTWIVRKGTCGESLVIHWTKTTTRHSHAQKDFAGLAKTQHKK